MLCMLWGQLAHILRALRPPPQEQRWKHQQEPFKPLLLARNMLGSLLWGHLVHSCKSPTPVSGLYASMAAKRVALECNPE